MMQVFFPCGKTSSDMPFGFVDIQHLSCTLCQSGVDLRKSFCYVFMYRTLADPKLLCRLPYCGVIVNNIFGYLHSSFLNITFQKNPLRYLFLHCMQRVFRLCQINRIRISVFTKPDVSLILQRYTAQIHIANPMRDPPGTYS